MNFIVKKPTLFEVAFTFERGEDFHQGVMPIHDCETHEEAEAYFLTSYTESKGWLLDACWEA